MSVTLPSPARAACTVSVSAPPVTEPSGPIHRISRIEANAADVGYKFVLVEVQTTGLSSSANLQTQAFRVSAGGERYSPTSEFRLNELLSAGETLRFTVPFEVPATVAEVSMVFGVPEELDEGQRAAFQIDLSS